MRSSLFVTSLLAVVAGCAFDFYGDTGGSGGDGHPVETEFEVVGGGGTPGAGASCQGAIANAPFSELRDDVEVTVPASCPGCPGAITGLQGLDGAPTATTAAIRGASAGASGCEIYVEGQTCGNVKTTAGTDPDGSGAFASTVPLFCGENIVRVACHNNAGTRVLVRRFRGTDGAKPTGRDLRLTLSWGADPQDLELHLIQQGGRINDNATDCTWTSCLGAGPNWGDPNSPGDDPRKDIDDLGDYGPENIWLDQAPPGDYDVMVEYWGSGPPSDAEIAVSIHEQTVSVIRAHSFALHQVWHVGQVEFPSGRFVPLNRVTACDGNWDRGCRMALPE